MYAVNYSLRPARDPRGDVRDPRAWVVAEAGLALVDRSGLKAALDID